VQQPGLNAYPENYAVDNSPIGQGLPPNMYVWPPAGGAYAVTARYYRQMPDIATPETSAAIPWFPNQKILIKMLSAALMELTNDDRQEAFMKDGLELLDAYLKMKDDRQVVKTVSLDRRSFGLNFDRLKNTKLIGW
jgi:hypothetical protein